MPKSPLIVAFVAAVLLTACTINRYRDVHHASYHLDLTENERQAVQSGREVQKLWYGTSPDGGYDSGALIVSSMPGKKQFHFIHTGRWTHFHRALIGTDSFKTSTVDIYDELGNQVSHTISLQKINGGSWALFQKSEVRQDAQLGWVMVLDNYHLNGKLHGHLEWSQPHFNERRSHRHKDHLFLPARSYFLNEKGDSITRKEYNKNVLVWSQHVGRMSASNY